MVIFFPKTDINIIIEAKFVTGPVNRNTKTLPTERPFSIKERAIGIDDVHQIYIGTPINIMPNIARIPSSKPRFTKKSEGTNAEISDARIKPTTK